MKKKSFSKNFFLSKPTDNIIICLIIKTEKPTVLVNFCFVLPENIIISDDEEKQKTESDDEIK